MLVVPVDDEATLVVPRLEAPRVRADDRLFELRPWEETEDPVALLAGLVGARRRLAISDRAWAALLLSLQRALPSASWRPASSVLGRLREVKDSEEIAALAAASSAADRVAAALHAGEIPLIGRSEAEVSAEIGRRLLAEGHHRVNFAIVASGPNAASPHHEPGSRVIRERETVVCDFGGSLRLEGDDGPGYCSDITRTVLTGPPDQEVAEAYGALQRAQAAAVAGVAPGVACEEIDHLARRAIDAAGWGECFVHRTGHGIGIEEHEAPWIVAGNEELIREGNAFSVEPGIYVPERFGMRIEDIVVATADGVRPLNLADHDLVVLEA